MIGIAYMGTKRQLAAPVAAATATCRDGVFLDLFSGMCSVGSVVSTSRQVWSNDAQLFASEVARALFSSRDPPLDAMEAASLAHGAFMRNIRALEAQHGEALRREALALSKASVSTLAELFESKLTSRTAVVKSRGSYDLFTSWFGGTYFGYRQAVEIDSIRFALDTLLDNGGLSIDVHRWLLLALCTALSRCTTTTGHFAQPLKPKRSNSPRFLSQRQRSPWREWLSAIPLMSPVGSLAWRKRNRVFRSDAVSLLQALAASKERPRVVYADPPYTKDQYSRYYHIYETALLYDYPSRHGTGQYRSDRFSSDFSLISRVDLAMSQLIRVCAEQNSDLILSYPSNGLLAHSDIRIPALISQYYGKQPRIHRLPHVHSSLGGSKGVVRSAVTEVLYQVNA